MKIVRFSRAGDGVVQYGMWRDDHVRAIVADPFQDLIVGTAEWYPVEEVTLHPPCIPTKIVAVGLNYRDHAEELHMELPQEPLIFLKPPSSLIGPGAPIVLPRQSNQVEHEAELAVVIKRRARRVPVEKAAGYILGYTCLNDVTARDLQKRDVQFTRSKSFDTFCPLGPYIDLEIDPGDLKVECRVNGEQRQSSSTAQLIHTPQELVSYISHIMTLEPGDVIATGTPKGVGPLRPGDQVEVSIQGIGSLKNPVVAEE